MAEGEVVNEADVANALPVYESRLDERFFRVRRDRTTELERSYLRAMAEFGPRPCTVAAVAEKLGRSTQQAGTTRGALVGGQRPAVHAVAWTGGLRGPAV